MRMSNVSGWMLEVLETSSSNDDLSIQVIYDPLTAHNWQK